VRLHGIRSFAFVAFVAFVAPSACHPPGGSARADAQADAPPDAPSLTVDRRAYPRLLNPAGPDGTIFFTGWGEGCHYAKAPRPELVPDLNAAEVAACPAALRDPAWNRCSGGALFASQDGKKCLCATGGPSPRAVEVACPEPAK
jgi:hypothetical protein